MARPGKGGNAERAAGKFCHLPLVAEKRAKARRFPMPRLSYVAEIFCSAETRALSSDCCPEMRASLQNDATQMTPAPDVMHKQ